MGLASVSSEPTWSPVGDRIVYKEPLEPNGMALLTTEVDSGDGYVLFRSAPGGDITGASWSPDGDRLAFAVTDSAGLNRSWNIATIRSDGSGLRLIAETRLGETGTAWSPDGSRIAFLRDQGHEIWIMSPDGSDKQLSASVEAFLEPDLAWVPGGTALLVSDGDWIYGVDVMPGRDHGDGLVRIVRGASPVWRQLPADSEPSPVPETDPSISPDPEPEGRDIGLGFNLCDDQRLSGFDFLGDGTAGTAWIGVPTNEDGTCPRHSRPGRYVVAEDHAGDVVADSWLDLPWRCDVDCVPFDATDLDANGTEELVVASYFSIMDFYVMGLQPNAEGALEIRPLLVAEPGHDPVGLIAGEPIRIDAGGDEGYGSQIECEGYPDAPVLIWSWSNQPVETTLPREVHITRLQLRSGGLFHVVATNDYTVPAGQPSGIQRSTAPGCGVDFHPSA